ncbi:MAG: PIN domain-containing protein [Bacteroidota bacterium]
MDEIFVDSDIILDLLSRRVLFHRAADKLFTLSDQGNIKLKTSALIFSNVHYILAKQLGKENARKVLIKFKVLVEVLSVNDKIIDLALSSDFKDFEDAVQYYTAIENGCSILLTRNLKDYKESQIAVMTAESYIKI